MDFEKYLVEMKRYYMCKKLVDTKIEQTWCV